MRRQHHSPAFQAISLGLALLLVAPPIILYPLTSSAAEPAVNYKAARDQAVHYYKKDKKRWKMAIDLLKKATATPDGSKDWKSWYQLAKIAREQTMLEIAVPAAKKSLEVAKKDGQKKKSKAMVTHLTKTYGAVTFSQDKRQKKTLQEGYILLDVDNPIINLQKKKVFEAIRDRFAKKKVKLPTTLYLPFGEYKANLAPFKIKKGEEAKATLILFAEPGGEGGIPLLWMVGGIIGAMGIVAGVGAFLLITDDHQDVKVTRIITGSR